VHRTSCQLSAFSLQLEPELIESSVFLIRSNLGWKLKNTLTLGADENAEVILAEIGSKQTRK
jgi:hypothetical protein